MTPWLQDPDVTLYHGDCLEVLRELPAGSVHMCATSPPFFGLRDYQTEGQIGLEETPDQWVERLVAVFREVRRVLRDDGTLWVEIGDSYNGSGGYAPDAPINQARANGEGWGAMNPSSVEARANKRGVRINTHKPKDLLGQPWLLAFALRADGWYLRSEIIWARPNPMPESVTDRPTKSHSTVFLLSKSPRYFYDADAIREASPPTDSGWAKWRPDERSHGNGETAQARRVAERGNGANARSVWQIPTEPTPFAHFATWPQALVRRMILAGTSERGCCPECGAPWVRQTSETDEYREWKEREKGGWAKRSGDLSLGRGTAGSGTNSASVPTKTQTVGWSPSCGHYEDSSGQLRPEPFLRHGHNPIVPCTVLDPFAGSGTTSLVARNHGRHSIGIELNESYLQIAARRLQQLSLLADA